MRYLTLMLCALSQAGFALSVGQIAPDFTLQAATDSKTKIQLSNVLKENDAAVVAFVATKCPFSNAYNTRYNTLFNDLKSLKVGDQKKKVAFLAINSNVTEPEAEIKSHAAKNQFLFPVFKDEKHKVADLFGAEKTPEVYLVAKKEGKLRVLYKGRIDDDTDNKEPNTRADLKVATTEFLSGKPIKVSETKAFGCSIKRN